MQVAGVYVSIDRQWSNVVCDYDVQQRVLQKVAQQAQLITACHVMPAGAAFMVFELQPPADLSSLQQRALHLPSPICCALVTAPCVILRASLQPLTTMDLEAVCAADARSQTVQQRRYQLQLHSVSSSVLTMLQPKQPKEWGEKKAAPRKASTTPKKRRVRVAEVQEGEDDVLEEAEDVEERDGEMESEEEVDVDDVDVDGEEDDEAEADDAGDDAEGVELEMDEELDEEEEEEVDDAVSANSSGEEANEAEETAPKREVKKARRG